MMNQNQKIQSLLCTPVGQVSFPLIGGACSSSGKQALPSPFLSGVSCFLGFVGCDCFYAAKHTVVRYQVLVCCFFGVCSCFLLVGLQKSSAGFLHAHRRCEVRPAACRAGRGPGHGSGAAALRVQARRLGEASGSSFRTFSRRMWTRGWTKSCTTLKQWETIVCWWLQRNHHSRVFWVVQDFVHPRYYLVAPSLPIPLLFSLLGCLLVFSGSSHLTH